MAEIKAQQKGVMGTSTAGVLATVPTGKAWVKMDLILYNRDENNEREAHLYFDGSSASDKFFEREMEALETFPIEIKQRLGPGDTLRGHSNNANSINWFLTVLEIDD